jgi:hypothetical protein
LSLSGSTGETCGKQFRQSNLKGKTALNIIMKYFLPGVLSVLLIAGAACEKSTRGSYDEEFLVAGSTLADSLSLKTIQAMNVNELAGVAINIRSERRRIHYYEYQGDKNTILKAISQSGFEKDSLIADTVCRRVSFERLLAIKSTLQPDEIKQSQFYWQFKSDKCEVYECIKASTKHIIVFLKDSKTTLHRIQIG